MIIIQYWLIIKLSATGFQYHLSFGLIHSFYICMGVHLWPACVENFSKVSERWCSHAGPEKRFEKKIWLCFAGVGLLLPLLGLKRPRSSAKNTAGGRPLLAKKRTCVGIPGNRAHILPSIPMHDRCVYGASSRTTIPCKKRCSFYYLAFQFMDIKKSLQKVSFDWL